MGSSLIFQFLFVNVLNYGTVIFTLTVQRSFKHKKRWKKR